MDTILSLIYLFSVSHRLIYFVLSLCPQPSAGTQIKKKTRITQTLHGLVFHGSFFDIIELMILGFDLLGFASAGALPFPGGIAIVTQHIDNSPHLTSNPS